MNLITIAKLILAAENSPISKVRFAKTIYFVHKELIRRDLAKSNDIAYIRMPLGPVPCGFMNITNRDNEIITTIMPSGLFYNTVQYSLRKKIFSSDTKKDPLFKTVSEILSKLRKFNTSELVEMSHEDPSWSNNKNSFEFYISEKDLENELPRRRQITQLDSDDQLIQAKLVEGMIDEMVDESTALEFPPYDAEI